MIQPPLDFSVLTTPTADGETLIEPQYGRLAQLIDDNRRRLDTSTCPIAGFSLGELREMTRQSLLGPEGRRALVVTGHQPEFYHAGVWAKNVVASRLARDLCGTAVNLIVDNDAPKKTSLSVPHLISGVPKALEVPYAPYHPGWTFEQMNAFDPQSGRRLIDEIRSALGEDSYAASAMPHMEPAFCETESAHDFVDKITRARKSVEIIFGLSLVEARVSRCWVGPLLTDILLNAPRFAECYNAALTEYRCETGIKGHQRPIPDLIMRDHLVELPVWVYQPQMSRHRLFVRGGVDRIAFHADLVEIGSLSHDDLSGPDGAALLEERTGWLFRPRALALTLWARLLLADLFIHGIGGAKYDRITDHLVRRYFRIEPPAMACVSATVRMDMVRYPVTSVDVATARHHARDLHYNPQRYVAPRLLKGSEAIIRRANALRDSLKLAQLDRHNGSARHAAFQAIRQANADILALDPDLQEQLAVRLRRMEQELAHNIVSDSREYFFGLLPMRKLRQMVQKLLEPVPNDLL